MSFVYFMLGCFVGSAAAFVYVYLISFKDDDWDD